MTDIVLLTPGLPHLPQYAEALKRGWSPDNLRPAAAAEQLEKIAADPAAFVAALDDPRALGGPVTLPDGSTMPRLPGFVRWVWDDEICGSIGFRWQPGGPELPPHVLGHIGYSIVPWKQGRGCATAALRLMLPLAAAQGLPYVLLTSDEVNLASHAVIRANGGREVERFRTPPEYGGRAAIRFRIEL